MTKFYCYWNNGTGWLEGPYIEEHPSCLAAYEKIDIGYGAYITETDENPNERCSKCRYMKHVCICKNCE